MALGKMFVFVVLVAAQAATKQEKIRPNYFSDSDSVFKYSSAFAFDPFTPFPEFLSTTPSSDLPSSTTTPRPISSTRRSKQGKSEIIDTQPFNTETTTAEATTTHTQKQTRKVIILRKKRISKVPKQKSSPDLGHNRGLNFTAAGVSRQETLDKNGTVHGLYSYTDATGEVVTVRYSAGKKGYRVLADTVENNQSRIKSKTDTKEWVQSILSRTTRRPTSTTTTTTTTTTTAPTPSTTSAPILTRELQLQLQKLLARRNLPEQSRSSSHPRYFARQQFSDTKTSSQTSNFPSLQFSTQNRFNPQQQFTPQQELARSQQQVWASQQQPTNAQEKTTLTQKPIPEQQLFLPQQSSGTNEYKKAILSQQQSHQAFLRKNRFRLQAQNYQQQFSKSGQQLHFPNQITSPRQQYHQQQQGYQGQYYNTQHSGQYHQQQTLNQQTPQQQSQLG